MLSQNIFLGMVGVPQIAIILVVVLLLFGGKKIPELMKGVGQGIKEFKKASNLADETIEKTSSDVENTVRKELK